MKIHWPCLVMQRNDSGVLIFESLVYSLVLISFTTNQNVMRKPMTDWCGRISGLVGQNQV